MVTDQHSALQHQQKQKEYHRAKKKLQEEIFLFDQSEMYIIPSRDALVVQSQDELRVWKCCQDPNMAIPPIAQQIDILFMRGDLDLILHFQSGRLLRSHCRLLYSGGEGGVENSIGSNERLMNWIVNSGGGFTKAVLLHPLYHERLPQILQQIIDYFC